MHQTTPPYSPAAALLAALYHESCRRPVADGTTLANAVGQAQKYTEFADLRGDVLRGRLTTATELLERFKISALVERIEPVSDRQLEQVASAIHECERTAIDRGWTAVVLDPPRPWIAFADLPVLARTGRFAQAKYLLDGLDLQPRDPSAEDQTCRELRTDSLHSLGQFIGQYLMPPAVVDVAGTGLDVPGADPVGGVSGAALRLLQLAYARGAYQINREPREEFSGWLVTTFQHGLVDPAAVLMPTGEYESSGAFCRRVLQLALDRGAFASEGRAANRLYMLADDATQELAQVRAILEEIIGRTPDPARSTLEVARDAHALIRQAFEAQPAFDRKREFFRGLLANELRRDLANELPGRSAEPTSEQGLFQKYEVRRVDGRSDPDGAEYFVLRAKPLVPGSPEEFALIEYALTVEETHPELARQLRQRYLAETRSLPPSRFQVVGDTVSFYVGDQLESNALRFLSDDKFALLRDGRESIVNAVFIEAKFPWVAATVSDWKHNRLHPVDNLMTAAKNNFAAKAAMRPGTRG